jgi:hypothetical protein
MKTTILLISVAANIVLAAYLARAKPVQVIIPSDGGRSSTQTHGSFAAFDRADASVLHQRLLQVAMHEEDVKPIVLAYVTASAAQPERGNTYEYWRKDARRGGTAQLEAVEERREATRDALLAVYGDAARDDPAFTTVFSPLQDRFPFLSSEQQIALRRLQSQRAIAAGETLASPPQMMSSARAGAAPARPATTAFDAALRQLMPDESTYLEYAMRESPLADRIRSTGVELTESEYRQIFEVMHDFQSDPTPSAFVAHRDAVRNTLGRDRALEFWEATDPMFPSLREASRQHDLREDLVLAAYEILLDAQDDLLFLSDGQPDARRAQEIRERVERRDRMLRELLGDAAANSIFQAQASRLGALGPTSQGAPRLSH